MALKFHTTGRISQLTASPKDQAALRAIGAALKASERGEDDDVRTIIADLISNDASPFTPDDTDSLLMMTPKTLAKMRDRYLSTKKPRAASEEEQHTNSRPAMSDRDRREAESFLPESTLVAHARRQGRDVAPIQQTLRERAQRARTAVQMAARSARPPGIALNAAEREEAAAFAPPSTLAAWRKRQAS